MIALSIIASILCRGIVSDGNAVLPNAVLHGYVREERGVFHGIQYATAARFQEPHLKQPKGQINATVRGASCWQPGSKGTNVGKGWETIQIPNSSEDCHFLSIYTPLIKKGSVKKFPVLVYMHAGEFMYGSSNDEESNFPYFSKSVVLVTPNYRLGLFGFSYGKKVGNGNMGMQDQREALRWVQQHITYFNGDPSKVTIMGESSGGTSVGFHLVNKKSWNLFSRAIGESPGLTQVKSDVHAKLNTEFVATSLSLKHPKICPTRKSFYKSIHFRELVDITFRVGDIKPNFKSAKRACSESDDCPGIIERDGKFSLIRKPNIAAGAFSIKGHLSDTVHLKWIVGRQLQRCLKKAPALSITIAMQQYLPFPDSFITDGFAPVVSTSPGHPELKKSILELFAAGEIAPNTDVLMGSNLDEASIMMGLLPDIPCNSSYDFFKNWVSDVYGAESPAISKLYGKLTLPIPPCRDETTGAVVQGQWRAAAMRTAGDQAILCPLKGALLKSAEIGNRAYQYYFMKSPDYSLNYNITGNVKGAFHGAEVPFVFGYEKELKTKVDRKLSKVIGCYWNSFIHTGDPSHNDFCPETLSNPKWLSYSHDGSDPCAILGRGECSIEAGIQSQQCSALSAMPKRTIRIPPIVDEKPKIRRNSSFDPTRASVLYTSLIFIIIIVGYFGYRHFFKLSPKGPDEA